jgi:hypothetical protein
MSQPTAIGARAGAAFGHTAQQPPAWPHSQLHVLHHCPTPTNHAAIAARHTPHIRTPTNTPLHDNAASPHSTL